MEENFSIEEILSAVSDLQNLKKKKVGTGWPSTQEPLK